MKWLAIAAALVVSSVSFAPEALSYNPPGKAGGPGHGKYWHRNPAGAKGGAGRGWNYNPPGPGKVAYKNVNPVNCTPGVNPPGGGNGHGKYWHRNPAGPQGGAGSGWNYNPPGPGRVVYR